jgi:S-adenosylhomocysteine hydrolase
MSKKYKFNEEDAKTIILLGQQGASQKAMYAAIGISKATALKLKKEDPVFAETMDLATTYGQAYWENMMLANVENKAFNSRVAELALRGQYPEDYKDSREQKVDLKAEVVVDFGGEVAKLIESLKEAK